MWVHIPAQEMTRERHSERQTGLPEKAMQKAFAHMFVFATKINPFLKLKKKTLRILCW